MGCLTCNFGRGTPAPVPDVLRTPLTDAEIHSAQLAGSPAMWGGQCLFCKKVWDDSHKLSSSHMAYVKDPEHALVTHIFGPGSARRFDLQKGGGLTCPKADLSKATVKEFWGDVSLNSDSTPDLILAGQSTCTAEASCRSSLAMLRTVGGKNPFAILGVARNAPLAEVRKVWMSEARLWHPDKRHHDTPKEHQDARQRFEDVHGAYEAIMDYYREHGENHEEAADSSERTAADAAFEQEWRVQLEAKVRKAQEDLDHAKQVQQEVEEYHNELRKQLRMEHSEEDAQALLKADKTTYVALTNCRMRVTVLQNGLKRLRQQQVSLRAVMSSVQARTRSRSEPPAAEAPELPCHVEVHSPRIQDVANFGDAFHLVSHTVVESASSMGTGLSDIVQDAGKGLSQLLGYFTTWRTIMEERDPVPELAVEGHPS
eukprot:s159_g6.t1